MIEVKNSPGIVAFIGRFLFKLHTSRTKHAWFIAALAAAFIFRTIGPATFVAQLGVLAWKLLLLGVAVGVAHTIRIKLVPYVDLSAHVEKGDAAGGQIYLGTMILYGAIILALLAGL